jgi:hypothetical protein
MELEKAGELRRRWKNNIKMDLGKLSCENG